MVLLSDVDDMKIFSDEKDVQELIAFLKAGN